MRIFSKVTLILFSILLVLVTVVVFSLNFVIQNLGLQEMLQREAEELVGMPVTMGKLYFTPWSGLYLSQLVVKDPHNQRSLESTGLKFFPNYASFFQHGWKGSFFSLGEGEGVLSIEKIVLNKNFSLENFNAKISNTHSAFTMSPFSGAVAKGKLEGSLMVQRGIMNSPYQLTVQFAGVSLKELMARGAAIHALTGIAQGKCMATGILENPEKLQGTGTLQILGMELKSGNFLAQLGTLLGIQEFQLLKFHEATAEYVIVPRAIVVKSLRLSSESIKMQASGPLFFDGRIDLNARLLLDATLQKRLQSVLPSGIIPSSFVSSVGGGYVEIPFKIRGTMAHPETDLPNKIPLPQINSGNVKSLINGLLNLQK